MGIRICSLASGSSGNVTYVSTGRTSVLIDCGTTAREAIARLDAIEVDPATIDGILITHAHTDHYRSAGTLNARYGIPIYVDPSTAGALAYRGRYTSWPRVRETRPIPARIGDLDVCALNTSHGFSKTEGRTVAYLLTHHRRKIGVVTDLGVLTAPMARTLRGVDAILIEANYDEKILRRKLADSSFAGDWHYLSWVESDRGHLSNEQCAEALTEIVTHSDCHVFLGHVSENHEDRRRDNNDHHLAMEAVKAGFRKQGIPPPHLHRTHRIGRIAGGPSDQIDL